MRAITQQTGHTLVEQTRALSGVAGSMQDVSDAVHRNMEALAEQARGTSDLTGLVDSARKEVSATARAVAEQAKGVKEIETSVRHVAKLASEVTKAMLEQARTTAALVQEADEVRRIAKQTTRAVIEQSEVLSGLAAQSARHVTSLGGIGRMCAEQAVGTGQIAQTMTDLRGNTREVVTTAQQYTRSSAAVAEDVAQLGGQVEIIRRSTSENAEALAIITEVLEELSGNRKGGRAQPEHP